MTRYPEVALSLNKFLRFMILATLLGIPTGIVLAAQNPLVRLQTNVGVIELELYADKAPVTVSSFVRYVKSGHYNSTIFHRVIKGFMIQGGGYNYSLQQKPTRSPIRNEAGNGLKNVTGTIAMARTPDPHSATSQFFINTADNVSLDHYAKSPQGWGYAVFGRVIRGMDVVRKIESSPTRSVGQFQNVPVAPVMIDKAIVVERGQK
jgi:cyclophilin family peptidyl-prolyl cis-trans isomerase